jgi:cell division protein FtsQ
MPFVVRATHVDRAYPNSGRELATRDRSGILATGSRAAWASVRRGVAVAADNRRRIDPAERARERRAVLSRARRVLLVLAGVAAGSASLYGAFRFATRGEALRIREIRFDGLSRSTQDELAALSPVRPGDNLLASDLRAMERALAKHPWVRAAEVRRVFPAALAVKVAERRAAAVVDLGGLYLVDRDGEPFKRAVPGDGLDLPVVTGLTREDWVQRRAEVAPLLAGALALLDEYAAAGLEARAQPNEVHVDAAGAITLYVGDEGTQVRLGTGDLSQKLSRLRSALAALAAAGRRPDVMHLDNRAHPAWVTVRVAGVGEPPGVAPRGSRAGGTGP